MRGRIAGVLISLLLVMSGGVACGFGPGSDAVAVSVSFGVVTFSIDTNGNVSVSVGTRFATPFGSVAVSAKHSESFASLANVANAEAEADKGLMVVIRLPDGNGGKEDYIYRIDGAHSKVVVELDGHVVEQIEENRVFIEALPGTSVTIKEAPAGMSAGVPIGPVAPRVPELFVGIWSGIIAERGDEYRMDMTINATDPARPIGTVTYHKLNCSGSLELARVDGGDLIHIKETMTRNPPNSSGGPSCVSPHTFTAIANPDGTILIKWDDGAGLLTKKKK